MNLQQENETLRVMLGKALGALKNVPCWDWDSDTENFDAVITDIEGMGIEEIGLPQEWEHPDVIAAQERQSKINQFRSNLMVDYGLVMQCEITREDIINDGLADLFPTCT